MTPDIVQVLRDYQRWMKAGDGGTPIISIEDINGDETFGAAANRIEELEEQITGMYEDAAEASI